MLTIENQKRLNAYVSELQAEEKAENTILKYECNMRQFFNYLGSKKLTKKIVLKYKAKLIKKHKPNTVNSKLNALSDYLKRNDIDIEVRLLNIKRNHFAKEDDLLTTIDMNNILETSKEDDDLYYYMTLVFMSTGIRVSEHKFITVEAVRCGVATVENKGSIREVVIPDHVREELEEYITREKIESGSIFVTKNGNPIHRSNIWRKIKQIGIKAGVSPNKLKPHNIRHYFARHLYQTDKDIVKVSAMLGHNSIETTRNYLKVLVSECKKTVEKMGENIREEINEYKSKIHETATKMKEEAKGGERLILQ